MSKETAIKRVPVLIVGGGPIGLALAASLGRHGIRALLVEKNDDKLSSAKMIEVSVRTMELCRQLGVAEKVRDWGFPFDYQLDSAFVTDLQSYEIGRIKTPSLASQPASAYSPERAWPCPQTWFDPILQRFARSFPTNALQYGVQLESFIQDEDGVTSTIIHTRSGASEIICS